MRYAGGIYGRYVIWADTFHQPIRVGVIFLSHASWLCVSAQNVKVLLKIREKPFILKVSFGLQCHFVLTDKVTVKAKAHFVHRGDSFVWF